MIILVPFLIRLTPHLIALALDLTAFEREEVETADWSDERDDFADDFVIKEWGIRRVKKRE